MTGVLHFIVMGVIGAFLSILRHMENWNDLRLYRYQRRLVEGAIIGYLYSILYNSYGFPDLIVTVSIGYTGSDLFERILESILENMANKYRRA